MRTLDIKPDTTLEELWSRAAKSEKYDLVHVEKSPRKGKDLFAILSSCASLVSNGGKITIEPFADTLAGETRVEATDVFLAVHRQWDREITQGQVLKLTNRNYLFFEEATEATRKHSHLVDEIAPVGKPERRGKKVISYALFGDCRLAPEGSQHRLADQHLPVLVRAHHALFPGWELRIHHDEALYTSNYGAVLKGLERQGLVKLVYVPSNPNDGKCKKMLWRLLPLWDEDVDYVFCRDVDSLPTWRERCADEEFIASGCAAGVIHDDPMHSHLMGGLCHFDARMFRKIVDLPFDQFIKTVNLDGTVRDWHKHGSDQDFLNKYVAHLMPSILEHQLFDVRNDAGNKIFRDAGFVQSKIVQEIRPFVDPNVVEIIKNNSDSFGNYIGSAGYRSMEAYRFYEKHSPVQKAVGSCEWFSAMSLHGKPLQLPVDTLRAVIAVDDNSDYYFYLPIIAWAWKDRIGYWPLVLLVGTPDHWLFEPKRKLAVDHAREAGAEIYFIGDYPGVRTSTVAQVSRLCASLLPTVKSTDYLLTTDADMLPLGKWIGDGHKKQLLSVYFANAYANEASIHYPMCYVSAQAWAWKNMLFERGTDFRYWLDTLLSAAPPDADGAWNYDERILTSAITAWDKYPDHCNLVDRHFVKGEWRIDRADWDRGLEAALQDKLEGAADAHLIRPGYTEENWPRVKPLLDAALDPDVAKWFDDYHTEFLALENTHAG